MLSSEAALTHVGNSQRHRHSTSAKVVLHSVTSTQTEGREVCLLCATGLRGRGGVSQGGPGLKLKNLSVSCKCAENTLGRRNLNYFQTNGAEHHWLGFKDCAHYSSEHTARTLGQCALKKKKGRKKTVIYSLFQQEFGGLTAAARRSINTTEERISRIYLLGRSPSERHANEVAEKQLRKSFNTRRELDQVFATLLQERKVMTNVRGRWACCKSLISAVDL